MNLLPSAVLVICLVPFWLPGTAAHAAQPAVQAQSAQAKTPAKPVAKAKSAPRKAKARAKPVNKAVAQPLPKPKLDLSLPAEMVDKLEPQVGVSTTRRKPLLPAMFADKPEDDSPFQLNGRLISNEMQLQLRNESRRDVEGAALDFEFRN